MTSTSTFAQTQADPNDVSSIEGIMRAYYEVVSGPAEETADVERDRSLHHPDAWIAVGRADDDGKPVVRTMTLSEFHGDNAPRRQGFWEWETDRIVHLHGNMASIWSSYAAAREENGEPFTTGVNAITLFHDGERWWIMNWMYDTSGD